MTFGNGLPEFSKTGLRDPFNEREFFSVGVILASGKYEIPDIIPLTQPQLETNREQD